MDTIIIYCKNQYCCYLPICTNGIIGHGKNNLASNNVENIDFPIHYRNIYIQYKSQPNLEGIHRLHVHMHTQNIHSNKMCMASNNAGTCKKNKMHARLCVQSICHKMILLMTSGVLKLWIYTCRNILLGGMTRTLEMYCICSHL